MQTLAVNWWLGC